MKETAIGLQSLLPGLAWSRAMIEGVNRAQAAFAADTLRKLNAPVLDALARQREFAAALAETAEQVAILARHIEQLARDQEAVTEALRAALDPYLTYVDWLTEVGAAEPPSQ
jgi:urease gamma subunit